MGCWQSVAIKNNCIRFYSQLSLPCPFGDAAFFVCAFPARTTAEAQGRQPTNGCDEGAATLIINKHGD